MTITAHYEKGTEPKVALVLSCPGEKEENAQKPAAGQTGINLEDLLSILKRDYNKLEFQSGLITIANS